MTNRETAEKIIEELLNVGLVASTWRDNHPDAYSELLEYTEDLVLHTLEVLEKG